MTIVYETYKDENGVQADIMQDKYCSCFRLDVYVPSDNGPATTLYRYDLYQSIANARRAMRRLLSAPKCIYNRKKGE